MKQLYGYLLAGIGLIGLFLSSNAGQKIIPITATIDKKILLYPSLALVALGIVILIVTARGERPKQAQKEVPIYKGEGRHRKIVGYKLEE
jgi:hypothetical protein